MTNVILVVHILVSIILIAVVLMQRSEGGALGIGGGGGGGAGGGLMSGRGVAGALVRTTMIFGAIFFITSIGLTTLASRGADGRTEIERTIDEEFNTPETEDPLGLGDVDDIMNMDLGDISDPLADPLSDPAGGEPTGEVPVEEVEPSDPLSVPQ